MKQTTTAVMTLLIAISMVCFSHAATTVPTGSVYHWGSRMMRPDTTTTFTAVAATSGGIIGIKPDGTAMAWGSEGTHRNLPGTATFTAVTGGNYYSLGLKPDGTALAWGFSEPFDLPTTYTGISQISLGSLHALFLRSDRTIMAYRFWYPDDTGACNVPEPNSDFIAVSAGAGHSLGLKSNGTVVAWGSNNYGQCNIPAPNANFIAIYAGSYYSLGLKSDGSIVEWGTGSCTSPLGSIPAPNSNFVAISGGYSFCVGLKADGSIVAWGRNSRGQCNVPSPNTGFVSISCGSAHSVARRSDGSIAIWGDYESAPPMGSDVVAVYGTYMANLFLKQNGSFVTWGCDLPPEPNTGFVSGAVGYGHGLGLKHDGSIIAWGANTYGQCNVPAPNTGFRVVAAGWAHSLGLKANGSILAWGDNADGQCNVPSPNNSFVAIGAGPYFSFGIKADGSIVAWGKNDLGQCNVPSPNSGFVAVTGDYQNAYGLKADGTIVTWGNSWTTNVPTPNSGFVAISPRMAMKADRSIVLWDQYGNTAVDPISPNSGVLSITNSTMGSSYHVVVRAADPGSIPAIPLNPKPDHGSGAADPRTGLGWGNCHNANSYDVYLWPASGTKPDLPTATGLTSPSFQPAVLGDYTSYLFQVVAKSDLFQVEGPVWGFRTDQINAASSWSLYR